MLITSELKKRMSGGWIEMNRVWGGLILHPLLIFQKLFPIKSKSWNRFYSTPLPIWADAVPTLRKCKLEPFGTDFPETPILLSVDVNFKNS